MTDGVDYSKLSNEELQAIASGNQTQQAPAQPQSAAALQDVPQAPQTPKLPPPAQLHPALGALGGSYLGGMLAGPAALFYASKAASDVGDIKDALKASQNIPNVVVTGSPAPAAAPETPKMTGGRKWTESLTGYSMPGSQMDKADLKEMKEIAKIFGPTGQLPGGSISEGGIFLNAKDTVEKAKKTQHEMELEARIRAAEQSMQQRAAAAAERSAAEAAKPSTMSRIATASVPKGAIGKMINVGIPTVSLGLAGAEGVDAWNRWNRGGLRNKTQAVIGGLGALGSAASMVPHPVARIGGTALSMGAPALNAAIDYIAPPEEQSGSVMPGVQPSGMGNSVMQGYADGGTVYDPVLEALKIVKAPVKKKVPKKLAKQKAELMLK